MNCCLSLQVYLPLQVGLIPREVLGPALRAKSSLIRNSNDQILVIFSCSIYFYNKNENVFLSLNFTKVNWYIRDLWFTSYYRQIPKEETILLWKYVCSVGSRVNTGLHNEKKIRPWSKLNENFSNNENNTTVLFIPYSTRLLQSTEHI